MLYIVLSLVLLALMYESKKVEGASKDMYTRMRKDGMSQDGLKKFVQMDAAFLKLEHQSVRSGIPYIGDAIILSNLIKQTFPKYDFSYHTIHLKQIAEPNKTINRNIKNM